MSVPSVRRWTPNVPRTRPPASDDRSASQPREMHSWAILRRSKGHFLSFSNKGSFFKDEIVRDECSSSKVFLLSPLSTEQTNCNELSEGEQGVEKNDMYMASFNGEKHFKKLHKGEEGGEGVMKLDLDIWFISYPILAFIIMSCHVPNSPFYFFSF